MFGSTIIDVAAGVIFGFLAISLFSSALMELINSVFGLRASKLKEGIQNLVNDPNFKSLAQQLYAHALVNPLGPGGASPEKNKPSYVKAEHFASALLDVTKLTTSPQTVADLKTTVDKIADDQIKQYLLGVIDRTSGDLEAMKQEVADWFDAAMDRLSGEFKRWNQLWTFLIALAGALLFNLDSIRLARTLWTNPALVSNLNAAAADKKILDDPNGVQNAATLIDQMSQARLPAGWAPGHFLQLYVEEAADQCAAEGSPCTKTPACDPGDAACVAKATTHKWEVFYRAPWQVWILSVLGWLVTAIAALFGAPFWFDALQSIVRVRGAGLSPTESAKDKAAAS